MITRLEEFDKVTAAGILARAALALEDQLNPAAAPTVPDEERIRAAIVGEIRKHIGATDDSLETRERLGDALDEERDALIGPVNSEAALERLAFKGELPSDLYSIEIIPNIKEFLGVKFPAEELLIHQTIKEFDQEQHFGPPKQDNEPSLISIFVKTFAGAYPGQSFVMLVAAARVNTTLYVHQAWRIYLEEVNLNGAKTPTDMLRRFSEKYGADLKIEGQHGAFMMVAELPRNIRLPFEFVAESPGQPPRKITVTAFMIRSSPILGKPLAALIVSTDLGKYRATLKKYA